jgi:hypothetical protein
MGRKKWRIMDEEWPPWQFGTEIDEFYQFKNYGINILLFIGENMTKKEHSI